MALPVILVNSATGSDTQASGAGPTTALFGTTDASFSGATVTLTASTDLTNVATDGSHVLYLLTSTGVRFFKITAKAGSGGATPTVDVTPNPAGTSTGRTWAIGGKRASVGSASSKLLFDNAGAAGDAMPGWTVWLESTHAETISARLSLLRAGNVTDGPIKLEGVSGCNVTLSAADVVMQAAYLTIKNIKFTCSGSTDSSGYIVKIGVQCGVFDGLEIVITGTSESGIDVGPAGVATKSIVKNCKISGGISGILISQGTLAINNWITGTSSHGISGSSGEKTGVLIHGNLITSCGGDGISISQSRTDMYGSVSIIANTINGCTSDGIEYTGNHDSLGGLTILNNILSNNGGYGLKFADASIPLNNILARGAVVAGNNTYLNTSGAYLPADSGSLVFTGDAAVDPSFTNTGGNNYSVGTGVKGKGFPLGGTLAIGTTSSTYSYVDPGAAQRQEAGGAGVITTRTRHTGGMQRSN